MRENANKVAIVDSLELSAASSFLTEAGARVACDFHGAVSFDARKQPRERLVQHRFHFGAKHVGGNHLVIIAGISDAFQTQVAQECDGTVKTSKTA